ncbi:MAG TPA: hypothetical protein VL099_07030 [Candidatus Binatia bacterium]|nr:hypothetical protein [Candidatus Binatia bacterium]
MKAIAEVTEFQRTHQVRIMPPAPDALKKKIHDAVSWRAFALYEGRGGMRGHEIEDWSLAEADVLQPMDCGTIVQDHRVCLTTNLSCFGPGTLELWVEPHRVTVCGPAASAKLDRTGEKSSQITRKDWIFRSHELSAEVDPAAVTVRFNGPAMHILLQRAVAVPRHAELVHAA